jgi:predicted transcriptional regulator of viral defense system
MRARKVLFQGTTIEFYRMRFMWGYKKTRYSGNDIFVAEKEKSVIDCLLLLNTPYDEVEKAISSEEIDSKKLVSYAIRTGNSSLMKRLGYLMESNNMDAGDLEKHADYNYIPLDWGKRPKAKKDQKWRVYTNR